jgi:alpha-beta hydrolase superfamily lysophospholipase
VLVLAALTACSETSDPPPASPSDPATALARRCGPAIPETADVRPLVLEDGAGTRLSAAEFAAGGGSRTVMVLLHQTGPGGLCGWGRFAAEAAERGIGSVAVDLCDYGDSVCAAGVSSTPEVLVDLAADHAREAMGARRVVLVGASMGGSETVIAVAGGADVDAWVDLSGPSTWAGERLLGLADRVSATGLPGLVAHAPDDDALQYAAARRLARASGARFLDGASGHGYDLLIGLTGRLRPDGRTVLDFVAT